ncbi:glycosyltransferase [Sanguibacter keddieii DSM 10542]|uniref:D-inositol 3-phosphate glycosyltransferase n=2 Tax=Sanguibacter keddieii TaxID=60920 RepID=D1BC53_SANKS|nr:glycosyltransferase [Sanguibacter keddieii DSM 10542]
MHSLGPIVRRARKAAVAVAVLALAVLVLAVLTSTGAFYAAAAVLSVGALGLGALSVLRWRIVVGELFLSARRRAPHLRGSRSRRRSSDDGSPLDGTEDVLEAWYLIQASGTESSLNRRELLSIARGLRRRGYLTRALECTSHMVRRFDNPADREFEANLKGEIAVLSGEVRYTLARPYTPLDPVAGRVLHVVGTSLPEQQSGYTLRTQYTAVAQLQSGLEPHVVTQAGFGDATSDEPQVVDGVVYHRSAGNERGTDPLDVWFSQNLDAVEKVIQRVRPMVLHAASDLINAQTALILGHAYGIPVVYESRGFWEETWLQREADRFGWSDLDELERAHGLPDTYTLRRDTEDACRRDAERVVTLADVMAARIAEGGVEPSRISVIPNGVDSESFPVVTRDETLAQTHGIEPETVTIGYVSSLVDYEGIDVLVDAVALLREQGTTSKVRLVVVGDGPERPALMDRAASLGLDDAIFTGKVPHDAVLDYYGLIDIFVVPRRPVEVCHLVTPLKPFEALSTGRVLVMSDVRALSEIAERSQAVTLFEAGSADSLAKQLSALISAPDERARVAAAGARWVRQSRTWSLNAALYHEVYEGIGLGASTVARSVRGDRGTAVKALFSRRLPVSFGSAVRPEPRSAESVKHEGWRLGQHEPVVFDGSPIDWDTLCAENRSWAFNLHAWDFMGPALDRYAETGDAEYLDWSRDIARSWAERFTEGDAGSTMAWYDMAIGLRAPRLALLLEMLAVRDDDRDVVDLLLRCVDRHRAELAKAVAFNAGSNHGFYVATGQLMFSLRLRGLPGMTEMLEQARRRLRLVARAQFAADGGHLEHSPEYHRMLLDSFTRAIELGLVDDPEVVESIRRAEDVLGWMVEPSGHMVQIGDSPRWKVLSREPVTSSPSTEFILSRGVRGAPAEETLLALRESGYAFVRYPQPAGTEDHQDSSYLSFMAGFHSRTHKHADDLSFTWFDRGEEIVVDAGRFGYVGPVAKDSPERLAGHFYSAPERQYVESTRAHSTVEVGGKDHDRVRREPYGSALGVVEERDGLYRLCGAVDHDTWQHEREIIFSPGEWLLVTDAVTGLARRETVRSHLNISAGFALKRKNSSTVTATRDGERAFSIVELSQAAFVRPTSGATAPLRGWRSTTDLELIPSWAVSSVVKDVRAHTFRTFLSFDADFEAASEAIRSRGILIEKP